MKSYTKGLAMTLFFLLILFSFTPIISAQVDDGSSLNIFERIQNFFQRIFSSFGLGALGEGDGENPECMKDSDCPVNYACEKDPYWDIFSGECVYSFEGVEVESSQVGEDEDKYLYPSSTPIITRRCSFLMPCPTGYLCKFLFCVPRVWCSSNSQCYGNQGCIADDSGKYRCTDLGGEYECFVHKDCPPNNICVFDPVHAGRGSHCEFREGYCIVDSDCSEGKSCVLRGDPPIRVCEETTPYYMGVPICETDNDCPAGQYCDYYENYLKKTCLEYETDRPEEPSQITTFDEFVGDAVGDVGGVAGGVVGAFGGAAAGAWVENFFTTLWTKYKLWVILVTSLLLYLLFRNVLKVGIGIIPVIGKPIARFLP